MRIKQKLSLYLIPLLIIPVLATGFIFFNNTSSDIERLHSEIMRSNLDSITAKVTEEHSILEQVGLSETEYYLTSVQTRLQSYINNIDTTDSFIHIYDFKGDLLFCTENDYCESLYDKLHPIINNLAYNDREKIEITSEDDERFIAYNWSYDTWEWHVVIFAQRNEIFSPIVSAMEQTSIILVVMAITFGLSFYVMTKNITKPLSGLISKSKQIGSGEFKQRIEVNTHDEFQELANEFNNMAENLNDSFNDLENEIAERKKIAQELKESEEKFRIIFNNTFHLIGLLTPEGRLLEVNDTAMNMVNVKYDDVLNEYFWETPWWSYDERSKEHLRDMIERAANGRFVREETYVRTSDGELITIDYSITPLFDSDNNVILLIPEGKDITDLKSKESQLLELNEELEQRVKTRTHELEESLETLKKTQNDLIESKKLAALGSMVAGISHEVNTPVGNGLTLSTYLSQELQDFKELFLSQKLTKSKFEEYVDNAIKSNDLILTNLKTTSKIIKDFKAMATEKDTENIEEFDLCVYINDILDSFVPLLEEGGHKANVICGSEALIVSNKYALSQLMNILVDNSIEHGFEGRTGEEIEVRLKMNQNSVSIHYRDTGCGMTAEQVNHIFEPFYTTQLGQGTNGLGMHIAYNLVNGVLGGKVMVRSTLGFGTDIYLELPLDVTKKQNWEGYDA